MNERSRSEHFVGRAPLGTRAAEVVDRALLEQLDACRVARAKEDLVLPELGEASASVALDPHVAAAWSRIQRCDQVLVQELNNVAIPEGLAERVMARLQSAVPPVEAQEVLQHVSRREPGRLGHVLRRTGYAAGIAAAILSAVVLKQWYLDAPALTRNSWREVAEVWYRQVRGFDLDQWQPSDSAPLDHPCSDRVIPSVKRWHSLRTTQDRSAAAYELNCRDPRERIVLLVVQTQVAGLDSVPPPNPTFFSHGCSLTAWQGGEWLYVLVIESPNPDRYYEAINYSDSPLANWIGKGSLGELASSPKVARSVPLAILAGSGSPSSSIH